jgi:FAD dependent oxidoreductase TIGR03364
MVIPSAMPPGRWLDLAHTSCQIYRELDAEFGLGITRHGTQYIAMTPTEEKVLREFSDHAESWGHACTILDERASRELNPALRSDTCRASLFFPHDLQLEPRILCRGLIEHLAREGKIAYLPQTVAVRIDASDSEPAVMLGNGEWHSAKHIFVCGGSETRLLWPDVFGAHALWQCELQMFATRRNPPATIRAGIASGWSIRRYDAFRLCPSWPELENEPMPCELREFGIHILLVQNSAGRIVIGDSHIYTPDTPADRYDTRIEDLIIGEARRLVDLTDWQVEERWLGNYLTMREPTILNIEVAPGVQIVAALGGMGMTVAPGLARESLYRVLGRSTDRTA